MSDTRDPAFTEHARQIVAHLLEVPDTDALRTLADAPFAEPLLNEHGSPTRADLDAMLEVFAVALPRIDDPFQAARLAFVCGVLIEQGGRAGLVGAALVERLRLAWRLIDRLVDEIAPGGEDLDDIWPWAESHPAATRAWLGSRWLHLAAMTTLCRDLESRQRARAVTGLRDALRRIHRYLPNGWYLHALLAAVDDLELVVLHPGAGAGWRVRVEAVRNNHHLFCLLEGALCGPGRPLGGRAPDPRVLAMARAETWERPAEPELTRLACHPWYALTDLGLTTHRGALKLCGEASPASIPSHEGTPVIIVGPADDQQRWPLNQLSGLHGAHRPRLELLETLSAAAVADWCRRLAP